MIRLFILLILVSTLFGCSLDTHNNLSSKDIYKKIKIDNENSFIELLNKEVKNKYPYSDSYKTTEILNVDSSVFIKFIFTSDNDLYEGFAYAINENEYGQLAELEITKVDKDVPFTHMEIVNSLKDNSGRKFKNVSGYINDKSIEEIRIIHKDNSIISIKIEKDQNTYMDYVIGDINNIREISAYGNNSKLIYSYKW
jgi:hypothetical protein